VTREQSSVSAVPAPIEHASVDDVYFQNGLLKANISWTVANGGTCCVILYLLTYSLYFCTYTKLDRSFKLK